jgi:hypothetical protein
MSAVVAEVIAEETAFMASKIRFLYFAGSKYFFHAH